MLEFRALKGPDTFFWAKPHLGLFQPTSKKAGGPIGWRMAQVAVNQERFSPGQAGGAKASQAAAGRITEICRVYLMTGESGFFGIGRTISSS
jgi:hypothetical protein